MTDSEIKKSDLERTKSTANVEGRKSIASDRRKSVITDRRKSILFADKKDDHAGRKSIRQSRSIILDDKATSRMKMRRKSYGFRSFSGIRPVDRTSQGTIEYKRPPLLYLNTYQLNSFFKFHPESILRIANEVLDELFSGHRYNPQNSPLVALQVAGDIMHRVKAMEFNRYRIIAVATVGQKRAQSYNNAVSFLWDHERDNYIDVGRELTTCFIQVTIFGIYFD